jgi:hypothetical protein
MPMVLVDGRGHDLNKLPVEQFPELLETLEDELNSDLAYESGRYNDAVTNIQRSYEHTKRLIHEAMRARGIPTP